MSKRGLCLYKTQDSRRKSRCIRDHSLSDKALRGRLQDRSGGSLKQERSASAAARNTRRGSSNVQQVKFGQLLDLWLQAEKAKTKDSTYSCYHRNVQKHIRPKLGGYLLGDMDVVLFEKYAQELLTAGKLDGHGGLSPKTVADILSIAKSAIEYGRYLGYPVHFSLSRLSVKKQEKEMRVLSKEEQQLLEYTLLSDIDPSKFGTLLSLYTGIRIGELCALKWDCLDLREGVLSVCKTLQRIQNVDSGSSRTHIIITEPKSSCSLRKIPLPQCLIGIGAQFQSAPSAFVLTGDDTRYIEPRTLQYRFSGYVQQSGIQPANFHALRHTFATRCVERGFDIKSLSEILGHANVNITLNRYVHSSFELKRENMGKLSLMG